jgi:hypothetical protein
MGLLPVSVIIKPSPICSRNLFEKFGSMGMICLLMMSDLLKITGISYPRASGVAGKFGLMGWKSHSLLIFSRLRLEVKPVVLELTTA